MSFTLEFHNDLYVDIYIHKYTYLLYSEYLDHEMRLMDIACIGGRFDIERIIDDFILMVGCYDDDDVLCYGQSDSQLRLM